MAKASLKNFNMAIVGKKAKKTHSPQRNVEVVGVKVEKGKQLLEPGKKYLVGEKQAELLIKSGRAKCK